MRQRFGYQPALDGVRALSIALVLAFHLGFGWMGGGYLGVSVFFTLSGFLITSLLLRERESTGRIDIRAFYVRRLRRLLPASLLCLAGIVALASTGAIAERSDLRSGVLGAVLQVANWVSLLGERSYADLFVAPSPVDHFWSLAIEEQFYWVWPVVIAGVAALATRPRTVAVVLTGAYVALAVGSAVTAQQLGGDAAYFASWARFAEIVAGAALAGIVAVRPVAPRLSVLAAPSLAAIVVLSVVTPAGRGWAYAGGLPVFALLSVALIAGVQAEGRVTRLLAREPLPLIGRVSYGLYLFHWPVFTIMDGSTWAVKLAVTGALTAASYHLVERPIRLGRVLASSPTYVGAAAVAVVGAAVAATALVPTVEERSTAPVVLAAAGAEPVASPAVEEATPISAIDTSQAATTSTAPAPPSPATVAVFGDSVADWLLRDATPAFARTDVTVVDAAIEGCDGAVDAPAARHRSGALMPVPDGCEPWTVTYPRSAERADLPIDVAALLIGNAPIVDRNVGEAWVSPCTDMQWYVDDVEQRVRYLRAHVPSVVLVLPPWGGSKASFLATDDHLERMGCIRATLVALASELRLDVVDLAALLCPAGPAGACTDHRETDGVHVDAEDAPAVLDWLLDRVLAA